MTVLIHVLGSNIPHHGRTVLQSFNDTLAVASGHTREFMVVGKNDGLSGSCPVLSVQFFPGKKSLVEAVIAKAKASRQQCSFFHGQFNPILWLALLSGGIKPSQFFWHAWGADLYELSSGLRYKLFCPLRRLAQKRVGCVFTTRGDSSLFAKTHPKVRGGLLYLLTQMDPPLDTITNGRRREGRMTILVGNSGDRSNDRITALCVVHQQFGNTVKVVVPVGYPPNNEAYVEEVRQAGLELFGEENLRILSEKLESDAYLALPRQCDLGYFTFVRQQGIDTLCLLIQAGIPYVLSRESPSWQGMAEQHLLVLFTTDDPDEDIVREAWCQLASVGKNIIAFLSPNYLQGWQRTLTITAGEVV